jgi:hypothetical protein
VRARERVVRRLQVTSPKTDLADLVLRQADVGDVAGQLLRPDQGIGLGLAPRAPPAQDAGPVDAAVAGGGNDALAHAAPLGRNRPLAGAPVVGELAADGQGLAIDLAGGPRPETTADRDGHRLIDRGRCVRDAAEPDESTALRRPTEQGEIEVSNALSDCRHPLAVRERALEIVLDQRELGVRPRVERMRAPFRLPIEQARGRVVPAGADGELAAREVLIRERCRDPRRRVRFFLFDIRGIRSLVRPEELVVAARDPCRFTERLEIPRPERLVRVSRGEKRERALPFAAAHGGATCFERTAGELSQALVRG